MNHDRSLMKATLRCPHPYAEVVSLAVSILCPENSVGRFVQNLAVCNRAQFRKMYNFVQITGGSDQFAESISLWSCTYRNTVGADCRSLRHQVRRDNILIIK